MLLPTIQEISILGVFERGVPNKERILLRPTEAINLGNYGLFIGKMLPNNMVFPYNDNFFWFNGLLVQPPSWIFIYTGPGEFEQSIIPSNGQQAYTYHWGRKLTVFDDPNLVPFLIRYGGITIGQPMPTPIMPQLR